MNTCKDCKFWSINEQDLSRGDCRRFPPSVNMVPVQTMQGPGLSAMALYPPIPGNFLACGEFAINQKFAVIK